MRLVLLLFVSLFTISTIRAQCEDLSLKEEVAMTENIALVRGVEIKNDSVVLEVIKKWKGDSVDEFVKIKQEPVISEYYRVDTGKTYLLFWFKGLSIDRCSRSSEFRFVHFEYQLDELLKDYSISNVPLYDTLLYRKRNVFEAGKQEFDVTKGKYAFYDVESGEQKAFGDLPVEISYFYPRRFYIIDKNVETATKKYDVVFAVSRDHKELIISKELKKKALQSLFK